MINRRIPIIRVMHCGDCHHTWGVDELDDENLDYWYCSKCGLSTTPRMRHPELYEAAGTAAGDE